jgi:hypothetical protein
MSNEQPSRPRRSGSNASPMGSTLAIVIAIAAVVVGFLILRNIRNDDDKGGTTATTLPASTTVNPSLTTTTVPAFTTTTAFVSTTTGATVLVANTSHQNGVAKQLTTALQGQNYTTIEPTNGVTKEALTRIQYKDGDTAAEAVARSLAILMGVDDAQVEIMPVPPQLGDPATLGDATVLVLLGDDKAGKTLEEMTAPPSETTTAGETTTTAAP